MIMGANMGTTITNTIVSLGNLRDRQAFGKSFEAATVHDFFNLYSIVIFLPIEIFFHPLEKAAGILAGWFYGGGSASLGDLNFMGAITKPVSGAIVSIFASLPNTMGAIATIITGIALIIVSVLYLGKLLRAVMTGHAQVIVDKAIGRGPASGIFSGAVITVLVQSSSTTTSLVVPLAGAGVLNTRQVYPFTMGANIGTCITALLAATAVTGESEIFALQIALVHLIYNVLGVLVFQLVPWLRQTPVWSAQWLGRRVENNRTWAMGYLGGVFFLLPGTVFGAEHLISRPDSVISSVDEEVVESIEAEVERLNMHLE
jgi:sodium-dependent phosphate cotransporter